MHSRLGQAACGDDLRQSGAIDCCCCDRSQYENRALDALGATGFLPAPDPRHMPSPSSTMCNERCILRLSNRRPGWDFSDKFRPRLPGLRRKDSQEMNSTRSGPFMEVTEK